MNKKEKPFGEIGCFVKVVGNRNKHQVISDEHIDDYLQNCVTVVELCTEKETSTTWARLLEWETKSRTSKPLKYE